MAKQSIRKESVKKAKVKKQINVNPKFEPGERVRTRNLLKKVKQRGDLREYLRYKWYLKLANFAHSMKIGYVDYSEALASAERNPYDFKEVLYDYSYRFNSDSLDKLRDSDRRFLLGKHLFAANTLSLVELDMKGIQQGFLNLLKKKAEYVRIS